MQLSKTRHGAVRAGLALAALAALVLPVQAQPSRKKIIAGAVRSSGAGVSGSYRIIEAADGIPSSGTGGACLVAILAPALDAAPRCDTQADCVVPPQFPAGSAYCLETSDPSGTRRCWIRPGPQTQYCHISKEEPNPVNVDIELPTSLAYAGWWRVTACVNGMVKGACGDPARSDRLMSLGPIVRVP